MRSGTRKLLRVKRKYATAECVLHSACLSALQENVLLMSETLQ